MVTKYNNLIFSIIEKNEQDLPLPEEKGILFIPYRDIAAVICRRKKKEFKKNGQGGA